MKIVVVYSLSDPLHRYRELGLELPHGSLLLALSSGGLNHVPCHRHDECFFVPSSIVYRHRGWGAQFAVKPPTAHRPRPKQLLVILCQFL
jgi:hypothetical protein